MNIELARFNMIEQQIRPWEVLDPARARTAGTWCAREDFVPPPTARWPSSTPRCRCSTAPRRPVHAGAARSRRACCRNCSVQHAREGARDRRRLGLHGGAAGAPRAARGVRLEIDDRRWPRMARANLQKAGITQRRRAGARWRGRGRRGLRRRGAFDVIVLSRARWPQCRRPCSACW
ncbi:MAG: hypothetical protein MZW92_04200 [Comamonadaceae bacterium]|nr:hypothetical protein [Comamonadaceae bacterium]